MFLMKRAKNRISKGAVTDHIFMMAAFYYM